MIDQQPEPHTRRTEGQPAEGARAQQTQLHSAGNWLMVAVGSGPRAAGLVRRAGRMARQTGCSWLAVHVEASAALTESARAWLAVVMSLAQELGAEVITTTGDDVAAGLVRIARQHGVRQIVVGSPSRREWSPLARWRSVGQRLVREQSEFDITVIAAGADDETEPAAERGPTHLGQYLAALLAVTAVTMLNLALAQALDYWGIALVYLLTVSVMALFTSPGPGFMAAAMSALLWNYLFIQPRFTFAGKIEDLLMLAAYCCIVLITGSLSARLRSQEQADQRREQRTLALYALAREVASAGTLDEVLRTAVQQIDRVFQADVAFLLPEAAQRLAGQPHAASTLGVSGDEALVAGWVFANHRQAGRDTGAMPDARGRYFPLLAPGGCVGVMGIRLREREHLTMDQKAVLETFASQVAVAVERELLNEVAKRTLVLSESERLYKTLFNSISHEFRTPLMAITAAAGSLLEPAGTGPEARTELLRVIQEAGERLTRLVKNLLNMARLESGLLKPNLEWCDVGDLLGVVVSRMEPELASHPLRLEVPPDLPLARMDFVLMEQVLTNLLGNAVTHTPPGTAIDVQARAGVNELIITVADCGPAFPPEALAHVFDKFYRAPNAAQGGTGLGLSICRGFVEAHRGTITAENDPGGGARFIVRLPCEARPVLPKEVAAS